MSNQNELINSFNGIAEEMMRLKTQNAALVEALQYAEKEISLLYYFALNHGVPEAENPPMDIIKDALEAVKS